MILQPPDELVPGQVAGRYCEDDALLLVDRCIQLEAVQRQEYLRRSMTDALVSIDEWVTLNEREPECPRLGHNRWIEVIIAVRSKRLGKSGLEASKIPEPSSTTRRGDQMLVEPEHLGERQVAHLRESLVEVCVFGKDAICGLLKIIRRMRCEIGNERRRQLFHGDPEGLRAFAKEPHLGLGEFKLQLGHEESVAELGVCCEIVNERCSVAPSLPSRASEPLASVDGCAQALHRAKVTTATAPVFVVGCPRSGTHFTAELFRNTLHYSSWHCDDVGKASGDSFLGYSKWHGHQMALPTLRATLAEIKRRD